MNASPSLPVVSALPGGPGSEAARRLEEQSRIIEVSTAEARTDSLTKLANRRAFDDEVGRRLAEFHRYGRGFSVVLADVDRFKSVNDAHGHPAGDQILRGIAATLKTTAREMDLVARYGGEEFGLVLPGTSLEQAGAAAERLRRAVQGASMTFPGGSLSLTLSFGVAQLLPTETPPRLLQRADRALYASKAAGRNNVHLHDGDLVRPFRPCAGRAALSGPPRSAAQGGAVSAAHAGASPSAAPRPAPARRGSGWLRPAGGSTEPHAEREEYEQRSEAP